MIITLIGALLLAPHCVLSAEKNTSFVARVGSTVITPQEFDDAISRLHTSKRVGMAIEKSGLNTAKLDYLKFLSELIDNRLIMMEAESLGVDKDKDFLADVELFRLNLALVQLKKEEVDGKVPAISDDELFKFMLVEFRKNIEKKRLEDKDAADKGEKDLEKITFNDVPEYVRGDYRKKLWDKKREEREKEYFAGLKKSASIKVYKNALNDFSTADAGTFGLVVAKVNGKEISGYDLLQQSELGHNSATYEKKLEVLERFILHRVLDSEALGRGYEKAPERAAEIERYANKKLVEYFKSRIIVPLVKIEESDIKENYEKDKERYRSSDLLNLRAIVVGDKKTADKVMKELKKGANFGYLAGVMSLDKTSGKKGGDMGWVEANSVPNALFKDALKAKKNAILGPYAANSSGAYMIAEYRDRKSGGYKPLEELRETIGKSLWQKRFDEVFDAYVERLRKTIPIEINEAYFSQ